MNPKSSRGEMGKQQDLEQGGSQKPQRTEKRTNPGADGEEEPLRRFRTP